MSSILGELNNNHWDKAWLLYYYILGLLYKLQFKGSGDLASRLYVGAKRGLSASFQVEGLIFFVSIGWPLVELDLQLTRAPARGRRIFPRRGFERAACQLYSLGFWQGFGVQVPAEWHTPI